MSASVMFERTVGAPAHADSHSRGANEKRCMNDRDNSASQHVQAPALKAWAQAVLREKTLSEAHAELVARCLVQTSLWGIDTHGIARLPHYLRRLETGSIEARPALAIEQTGAATASVDGGHGLGMVVCDFAMDHAIRLAGESGAGVVGCRHSTHCGAIGLYGRQAARRGPDRRGFHSCGRDRRAASGAGSVSRHESDLYHRAERRGTPGMPGYGDQRHPIQSGDECAP